MKKTAKLTLLLSLWIFLSLHPEKLAAQQWQDLYSYNKVKQLVAHNDKLYAVSENALFSYETSTGELEKISTVNGLSGGTISHIHYSSSFMELFVGYASGLLEIVDEFGEVESIKSIQNFNYIGGKSINHIAENDGKLYLATTFGVVVYDLNIGEFSDTYFLGENSSEIAINYISFLNNRIYVASEKGLHEAELNEPFLIDSKRWKLNPVGEITQLQVFNNQIFATQSNVLYKLENDTLQALENYPSTITSITKNQNNMVITTNNHLYLYDNSMNETFSYSTSSASLRFSINQAIKLKNKLYIATEKYGILETAINQSPIAFEEIHPDGPTSNTAFSIAAKNDQLWMVYGGYNTAYGPLNNRVGMSHYNGSTWNNIPYADFGVKNLVHITFDNLNTNKVYISSWGASSPTDLLNTGGILVMENDQKVDFWDYTNSGLDEIPGLGNYKSTRIHGSAFDVFGNLWVANSWVAERVKKRSSSGEWSGFDMTSTITNGAFGLNELTIDQSNTIWIGSRRNGVLIFNETNRRKMSFTTEVGRGGLPNLNVRTVKADNNNRIWIGTLEGLVVFKNASNVFNQTNWNAEQIILEKDGETGVLLGSQVINSIDIDGAGNKWFATATQGVVQTNPNGTEILKEFNQENSPLPSNNVLKISVDQTNGKVFIATDKGTLVYDSDVVSYGKNLSKVYAYPNPCTRASETVTIAGKNNQHLPYNTNIKIVDSAGNLVYETIVKEGIEPFGGKVVWNKRNLAGKEVASGIYIVLISSKENTQTQTAKIAIVK